MTTSEASPYGPLVETTMRVATWNLWWRFGPWEQRWPAIVETVRHLDPDVIALQEVWDDGEQNQAALLAAALGFGHHAYSARLDLEGVRFGNAVVSRWPIVGTGERGLPAPDHVDELRTQLRADVDGPRGPFQVFSTHLNWRFDQSAVRVMQARAVAEFVRDAPARGYPPIVCGDFNADPESDEIRMLTGQSEPPVPKLVFHDAWRAARRGGGPDSMTWSNENPYAVHDLEPDRRIDYVLVGWPKEGGRGHVTSCEVFGQAAIDGVVPSDHYGVTATLRY